MRPYVINLLLLILSLVLSVAVGSVFIPPATLVRIFAEELSLGSISPDWPETFTAIIFKVRLPHTVLVVLTGAGLAGSGAAYQGLFRNPLADPFLIGVASGAGLGAVFALSSNWPDDLFGLYTVPIAAFVGAIITVFLAYQMSRSGSATTVTTLILAGVALSSFASALTSFMMLRSNEEIRRALGWLLGGSILGGWPPVVAMLPYILLGLAVLIFSGHSLNVLQFGEEQAQQLGLNVERTKILIILFATLTTAASVAFSGIIGFIGLMVPHLIRIFSGSDYRHLIPLSILGGGTALLLADLVARTVLAPQTLPVGIVTALIGGPFFLWILRRSKAGIAM